MFDCMSLYSYWQKSCIVVCLQDQLSAAVGASGAPSVTAVICMIFALLLVNSLCYNFLLHVIYWLVLSGMGFR